MAKVPKLKNQRPRSKNSRAARRAASPTIDTPKSNNNTDTLTSKSQPTHVNSASILSARPGAGVSKRRKTKQKETRQQRLRREKGMARADAVSEQLSEKVRRSSNRERAIKGRRKDWDELNDTLPAGGGRGLRSKREKAAMRSLGVVGTNGDEVMVDGSGAGNADQEDLVQGVLMEKVGELTVSAEAVEPVRDGMGYPQGEDQSLRELEGVS